MDPTPPLINPTDSVESHQRPAAAAETRDPVDSSKIMVSPMEEAAEDSSPPPLNFVIPGAIPHKYYRVPDGLKSIRPKRKVALVFGYIGEKYCGLQWNHLPNYPTIEESLLKAMFECDLISAENFRSAKVQQLIGFERASRTDKGVHALRNVISVNLMLPYSAAYVAAWERQQEEGKKEISEEENRLNPPFNDNDDEEEGGKYSYEAVKTLLNEALPEDIVVYDVVPATRSFNAYLCCGGRQYEYYLPTFALMPRELYISRFFPATLAPADPLPDVDVRVLTGGGGGGGGGGKASKEGETAHDSPAFFPRRGHFPMRKSKRRRLSAQPKEAVKVAETNHTANESPNEPTADENDAEKNVEEDMEAADEMTRSEEKGDERNPRTATTEEQEEEEEEEETTKTSPNDVEAASGMALFRGIPSSAMREVAAGYRLPPSHLARVRQLFSRFEGTHRFHRFTPGGKAGDPRCDRFLRRVEVSDPFIVHPTDEEIMEAVESWTPFRFFSPDDGIAEAFRARWEALQDDDEEGEKEKTDAEKRENPAKRGARDATGHPSDRQPPLPRISRVEIGEEGAEGNEKNEKEAENENENDGGEFDARRVARLRREVHRHLRATYGDGGLEVVRIALDGQSFLLNQIRKMIGAVVAMLAAGLPDWFLEKELLCVETGRIRGIPMAPANGLLLSSLEFTRYNHRLARIQKGGRNARDKRPLVMDAIPSEELTRQRRRTVAVVLRNEMAGDIMGTWMRSLRSVLRTVWNIELP
ncbi:unnamed protein product [Phytomonas sp. EM1]|nr:unnamed protein product [Phytomonas sp. EM1]|eukprot:CCW60487.1 unnamed protein product [Phytomonas sp. isolate EM1]